MATLEKIRSKSVFLLIIVGVALLAFIIGDFFTSGRTLFGTGTTIAKVGDQKVDIHEFQNRVQQASQQAQQSGQRIDNAVLQKQVLDAMIAEKLFDQEIADLGITVTDAELTEMMVGKNSAYVDRMVQQQLGMPDAATVHDMAFNSTKYGIPQEQAIQLQQYWLEMEQNIEKMLLQQKFQNLFGGLLTANKLDAKSLYDDNAPTANIIFAKKDYSSLEDDEYPVESSDINALYNSEKNRYALTEPVRLVNYISVNIAPSREDVLAGQKKVEDALLALNDQPDLQGISDMPEFVTDRQNLTASAIENQTALKAALDTLSVGRATLVNRNGYNYNIAKLLGKNVQSDKAVLDFLAVQGTRAQIDSLTALLNGGASFDSIAQSPLVAQSQKAMDVSLIDANASMVKELIAGRATGVYFAPDTLEQGGRIVRIAELATPVSVYDVANITFTTEPSNSTVNSLENSLQDYVATHKTAKAFADSAQAGGYTVFPAYITPSTPMLGNLSDSHTAVAWVIDASKGEVSPVFGDLQTGHFIAVALDDIYEGYTPARDPQLNAALSRRVLNNKKAAKLIADYQGKANNIPAYAKLMGDQVDTTTVNFSQSFIPGIGVSESEILGRVAAAKAGDIVGPMQGKNAVIVLQVTGIDNQGRPYDFNESATRFEQQRGASRMMGNLPSILRGNKKVKNNINVFYK